MAAAVPADEDLVWPEDAVEVGRILDAWGIKGGIRVKPFSAEPEALFSSRRWYIQRPADRPAASGPARLMLRITGAREQGEGVVATAQELPDRNAAEALRGYGVFVPRSSFPSTTGDEFYWVDLIGLEVINRENEVLGRVADLMDTGVHSVLRVVAGEVDSEGKTVERERLIPFVAAYIDEVSLAQRRIRVDWGLDY